MRIYLISLVIISVSLSSCYDSFEDNKKEYLNGGEISKVSEEVGLDICENSPIHKLRDNVSFSKDTRILFIKFSNDECIFNFYKSIKISSDRYVNLDDEALGRALGVTRMGRYHFLLENHGDRLISIRLRPVPRITELR